MKKRMGPGVVAGIQRASGGRNSPVGYEQMGDNGEVRRKIHYAAPTFFLCQPCPFYPRNFPKNLHRCHLLATFVRIVF